MKFIVTLALLALATLHQEAEAIVIRHKHGINNGIDDDEEDEDKEIMDSIKFAE